MKKLSKHLSHYVFIFFILLLVSCSDDLSQPYKDLEITFPEVDFAEFRIYNAQDSTLVISDVFDREYVQSLHYGTFDRGDYYLNAESGSKETQVEFNYDGGSGAVVVLF